VVKGPPYWRSGIRVTPASAANWASLPTLSRLPPTLTSSWLAISTPTPGGITDQRGIETTGMQHTGHTARSMAWTDDRGA
jgi:hypothetical protein